MVRTRSLHHPRVTYHLSKLCSYTRVYTRRAGKGCQKHSTTSIEEVTGGIVVSFVAWRVYYDRCGFFLAEGVGADVLGGLPAGSIRKPWLRMETVRTKKETEREQKGVCRN